MVCGVGVRLGEWVDGVDGWSSDNHPTTAPTDTDAFKRRHTCLNTEVTPARKAVHASSIFTGAGGCGGCCGCCCCCIGRLVVERRERYCGLASMDGLERKGKALMSGISWTRSRRLLSWESKDRGDGTLLACDVAAATFTAISEDESSPLGLSASLASLTAVRERKARHLRGLLWDRLTVARACP